jgi:hypothetical protein
MMSGVEDAEAVEKLLETPDLATALESEQFKKFLDQVPIGIAAACCRFRGHRDKVLTELESGNAKKEVQPRVQA